MTHKSILTWLSLDMAIFIIANALLLAMASLFDRLTNLSTLGYFDLVVFGLAIYRAAQIISSEPITKPPQTTLADLNLSVYCPSCTGVWLAAAFAYAYVFFPAPTFLVAFFLALSAIERLLSTYLSKSKG